MEWTMDRLQLMDIHALALGHHYGTRSLPRESIHFGANAKAYLQECHEIADMIATALRQAASAKPQAAFMEVAQAATDLLFEQLPIIKNEDGLATGGGVEALYGYWQLLK
jgi:hypothetical protein